MGPPKGDRGQINAVAEGKAGLFSSDLLCSPY